MRAAPDRWPEAAWILTLLGTLALAVVAQTFVSSALGMTVHSMSGPQLDVALGLRETVATIALAFFARRYLGISLQGLGLRSPRWREIGAGILAAVILYPVSMLVVHLFPGGDHWIYRGLFYSSPLGRVFLVFIVGGFSPIVQELIFRGLLFQGLAQRVPIGVAIVLSALIFAVIHYANGFSTVVDSFVFGIVAAGLFVAFRSLTAAISLHVAVNTSSAFLMLAAMHAFQ